MEPNESYHQYMNSSDEQPKDLTVKTAKKMKPIPPPLNLIAERDSDPVPMTLLKEFANFATSPKSPLMLKHLPFRKRAHVISENVSIDSYENETTKGMTTNQYVLGSESDQCAAIVDLSSHCRDTSESCDTIKTVSDQRMGNENSSISSEDTENKNVSDIKPSTNTAVYAQDCSASSIIGNAPSGCDKGILSCSEEEDYVLDLSVHPNSVLLSPAPSSLGSSREELASDSSRNSPLYQTRLWGLPWPPPVWHCFQSGTKLKVGSVWFSVEEMGRCPIDLPSELKVDQMSLCESSVIISFSSASVRNIILAEVSRAQAFLVKDRGWTAVCGESLFSKYSVRCPSLQLSDVIMLPTIHRLPLPLPLPSPDICERIKRFSFPPPDDPQSPQLLSPPTTPTRKNQDCDKPKRPMNAFMLFAKRFRLELIQSHPGKDNRAISVILGEVWRTLPQEEREIYIRGARDLSEEQKLLHPDCWKRKRSHSTS